MDSFKKPLCVTGQLHAPWMFSHLDGKRLKDRKTADMRQVTGITGIGFCFSLWAAVVTEPDPSDPTAALHH
ncbi:hypothetical protein FQA47_017111 [Oryzias melastigma]|uniref:Uncharacterized protein n=1 Tax=Oryzias melastigma TaxID=30732 RepID=A0A834C9C8_ORYME|nr:hypothetical protein FQA47_017111 [Oryzias melastigma]